MSRNRWFATAAAFALATTALAAVDVPAAAAPQVAAAAPGGPGSMSHFGLARKDCVGTARNTTSKVWFTVAGGVLSDVYYPTIDNTNIETLQYIVTDGKTFTDVQARDTTYTVEPLDPSGMSCRVTSTANNGKYELVTDYITDPDRNSVAMKTVLKPAPGVKKLSVYVRMDATVNGNGGGGNPVTQNAGEDDAVIDTSTGSPVPVAIDTDTSTIAANRDYATPVFVALRGDRAFLAASSGYAGSPSDGLVQLDTDRQLSVAYTSATDGNVVQIAQVDVRPNRPFTIAVGFGDDQDEAVAAAASTATTNFNKLFKGYSRGWDDYIDGLVGPGTPPALSETDRAEIRQTYNTSAAVLKASEDKTFPGAIVASLASPWGQAVAAGDPALTYFGSYREVFARDLYETFTGLMAAGDTATAEDTVRFLFERQQLSDGSFPRNSLINGKVAPDSFGVQLDEVAYPILMARTVGLTSADFYAGEIRPAADFLVAHGPSFGSERWEEQSGFSPSTIAAEIAGLAAAGAIAEINGDMARARIYRATADHYQRSVKDWTVTSSGLLDAEPYFIRLSKTGDPNAAISYNLGNGSKTYDQREIIDAGFLELPRLGILHVDDTDVANSVAVVDRAIAKSTASGEGFYRYGTIAVGTEDGYGDCNLADETECTIQGKPWAGVCAIPPAEQNKGSGHLWPALAAERGQHDVALGDSTSAAALLLGMSRTGSGVGLIPEQVWENADLPASPFGTQPECASIGFVNGKPAGSASPLTWSAASFVRLDRTIRDGEITEQPEDTVARYIDNEQGATTLTLTSPANGTLVTGTATVSGTTAPGATVDVDAVNIDIDGAAIVSSTVAGPDGSFTFDVPVPPGTSTLTVTATAPNGDTAFAQRTVVFDVVPGTLLFAAADPDGDDNGPGTYDYPTSDNFHDGAFDLQAFEVYDSGPDTVTFRVRTRDLSPTFGSALGAQLIDVYVRDPAAATTSTEASFALRNYTIDPAAAWSRLIEVQGFGQRFIDASGTTVGTVTIRGTEVTRWITFTVNKAALGGTPGSGWSFAVVLTGQDGFSPDQARGFQAQAQDFQFGVCTPEAIAAANPICAVDPTTVPKAMDILTPEGTSQADVLNPLSPPVVIPAVTIP